MNDQQKELVEPVSGDMAEAEAASVGEAMETSGAGKEDTCGFDLTSEGTSDEPVPSAESMPEEAPIAETDPQGGDSSHGEAVDETTETVNHAIDRAVSAAVSTAVTAAVHEALQAVVQNAVHAAVQTAMHSAVTQAAELAVEQAAAQAAAQAAETEANLMEHIRACGLRPTENGVRGSAGVRMHPAVDRLTRQDRAALAERAARGESVRL